MRLASPLAGRFRFGTSGTPTAAGGYWISFRHDFYVMEKYREWARRNPARLERGKDGKIHVIPNGCKWDLNRALNEYEINTH